MSKMISLGILAALSFVVGVINCCCCCSAIFVGFEAAIVLQFSYRVVRVFIFAIWGFYFWGRNE